MSYSEWSKFKLGEIATFSQGIQISVTDQKTIPFEGCVRFIRIVDFSQNNNTDVRYIKDPGRKYLVNEDDLVMIRYGSQTAGKIVKGFQGAIANNTFKVIPDESRLDKLFLYYFLFQKSIYQYFQASQTSTTMPAITFEMIGKLEISFPDILEQNRIASILCSLDDKIELNRQTNKTLETIAQTLFKEMCLPKEEELIEGWEVGVLKDVLEIKYGKDHKHLDNGSIPLYGSGGIMRYVDKSLYENESILIPRKGTLSNLFYINKPFWSVDTMFYSKIKKQYHGKFLFHLLQSLNLASMNVGSAVPSLTTEVLNNIEINIPPNDILKKFDDLVTPIFQKLADNEEESNTLATLRDSLLPKLMKGEISV